MGEINSYEYWLTQISGRSKATQDVYKIYFRQFLNFTESSPNELIEKYDAVKNGAADPRERALMENKVTQWLNHLKKSKSPATVRMAYTAVKSFFDLNRRPLSFMPQDKPKKKSRGSRIPEKKEVIKIADTAKSKYRAAVMVLKDSGLRCSDVVRLRWEDRVDMGGGFWHWRLETQKTGEEAMIFIGPESTRLLKQFKNKEERLFAATRNTFNKKVNRIIRAAGVKDLTAHGLRKYYVSCMQAARVPEQNYLVMMGKAASVYSENRRSELFEVYKKAYPKLSIYSPESKAVADLAREVTELQKENLDLKSQLNGQRPEMVQLRRELDELKTTLRKLVTEKD